MSEFDTSAELKISASNTAIEKIKSILVEEGGSGTKLRVFVQGGGCSGMQYGFTLDSDLTMDDFVLDVGSGVELLVDSASAQYLHGAEIDYKEDVMGEQFTIKNPNAETTCGCGSSFNPY